MADRKQKEGRKKIEEMTKRTAKEEMERRHLMILPIHILLCRTVLFL